MALAWVTGITLVQGLGHLPSTAMLGSLGLVMGAALWRQRFPIALLLGGVIWASLHGQLRLDDRLVTDGGRRLALVEGEVLDIPKRLQRGIRFDLAVQRSLENGKGIPDKIRISWYDPKTQVRAGEQWRLQTSLRPPHGMANPAGFDYEGWLFASGIGAVGYVRPSPENRRIEPASLFSPHAWRQSIHDRMATALEESPVAGLIEALTTGTDEGITPSQWEILRRTGTTHLIAISGSHIGLVAALVFLMTRKLCARLGILRWSPPTLAALSALLSGGLYSALTGFAIPTRRAMIMIAVAMGAILLQRPALTLHTLTLALLVVVTLDPLAVVSPGFWLSFGAVALITYGVSGRLQRASGWRTLIRINGYTALGLAPLLLLFFRQISLISPLANLLAIPILGMVLTPLCLLGALLLPLAPWAGSACLQLAAAILTPTWGVLEALSALPGSQWLLPQPPLWMILLALAGALLLLAPRGIPRRWLGLTLLLPATLFEPERPDPGAVRLTLLDVGQGLASVVETHRHTLIFDTGTRLSPSFDMGSAVIAPYLQQRGIGEIDRLIISHGDLDHIGGAHSLLARFPIHLTLTSRPEKLPGFSAQPCHDGQQWHWDEVRFEMLGPPDPAPRGRENDRSCVLKIEAGGQTLLMTGDIEREAERQLLRRHPGELKSDLLIAPHHGSRSSSTRDFLDRVRPRWVLIPSGYLNRYRFPHPEVIARYRAVGAKSLTTGEMGAISITLPTQNGALQPDAYRDSHPRYWQMPPTTSH